jgi:rSAM/selenodomain-associated transferase 2
VKVSVVMPVFNELERLPLTLANLQNLDWIYQIIVADGASTDGTREWLGRQPAVTVVDSPPGKGKQLNAGAGAAKGDLLLFLHADCLLPPGSAAALRRALADPQVAGGCFCVSFAEKHPRLLSLVAWSINLRTRVTRTATGDQGIFVRKDVFDSFGGCADWPLFEDVDLVRRIKQKGRFQVLSPRLTISARRHVRDGVIRTVLRIYVLRLGFWVGISPSVLKRWFNDDRA